MDKSAQTPHTKSMHRALRTIVKDEVQQIIDHFCYSLNVRIVFYTPDGAILRVGLNRPDSEFCRLVRRLYGEARCLTLDESMREDAGSRRQALCYTCHAGLNESIEPIYAQDVLIGYAMLGQFRSGDPLMVQVKTDWQQRFGDAGVLTAAFEQLPTYDGVGREHVIGLFRLLVEYVVSKNLIAVAGSVTTERLRDYLRRHCDRNVGVAEVAAALGKSRSTISHLVKRETGRSFKRLAMETRIQAADRLLRRQPPPTIAAVAEELGYADAFYFSRVYKKLRGYPPSAFRHT